MGLLVLQKPLLLGPGPVGLQAPPLGLQGVLHPGQVAEEGLGLRGVGPGGEVQPGAEEVEGPLQRPPQAHLQAGKVQVGPRSLFQEEAHPVASGKPGPEGRLPLAVRAEASGLVPSGGLQAAGGAGAEGRPQDPPVEARKAKGLSFSRARASWRRLRRAAKSRKSCPRKATQARWGTRLPPA